MQFQQEISILVQYMVMAMSAVGARVMTVV
jgi:hypothetical protein